jgi:hypothetical protein
MIGKIYESEDEEVIGDSGNFDVWGLKVGGFLFHSL